MREVIENSVTFVSPRRCVPISDNGLFLQKARTNFCIPASTILGALSMVGFETHFIDAAADGFGEGQQIGMNVLAYGLESENIVEKIAVYRSKYILITSMFTFEQYLVDELVNKIKLELPHCIIILGGIHASVKPEWHFADSLADYIVCGEGEQTIAELLTALHYSKCSIPEKISGLCFRGKNGRIYKTAQRKYNDFLNGNWAFENLIYRDDGSYRYIDKFSRKSPIYVDKYIGEDVPSIALFPSRGCPMNCDYCTATIRDGWCIRHMGAEKLWDYFIKARKNHNIQIFYNQSDTFGIDSNDWLFLEMIADYRIKEGDRNFSINNPNAFFLRTFFMTENNITKINSDRITLIQAAGINVVTIAIETFTQRFNKKIKFDRICFENILALCKELKKREIKIDVYMVYGFPGQTKNEFKNDLKLVNRLLPWIDWVNWHFCVLLPGTSYYDSACKKGQINEWKYRERIRDGYNFFYPVDEFNFSQIPTEVLINSVSDYGSAWI